MLSFKGIDEKIRVDRAEREGLNERVVTLLHEKADAEKAMQTAAANGDLEGFNKAKKRRDDADSAVFVIKSRLTAPKSYEIRKAVFDRWDEYATKRNKDFMTRYAKYLKHRKELIAEYLGLVEDQNAALRDLKSFNEFTEENDIDREEWPLRQLEYLDKNAPEIEFITKTEQPDLEMGLYSVVKGRMFVKDMTEQLDPRLMVFLKCGKTI